MCASGAKRLESGLSLFWNSKFFLGKSALLNHRLSACIFSVDFSRCRICLKAQDLYDNSTKVYWVSGTSSFVGFIQIECFWISDFRFIVSRLTFEFSFFSVLKGKQTPLSNNKSVESDFFFRLPCEKKKKFLLIHFLKLDQFYRKNALHKLF